MKFKPDCVNVDEVLPHWLSWLPLHEDKEEAVQTFSYLCDLIERYGGAFLCTESHGLEPQPWPSWLATMAGGLCMFEVPLACKACYALLHSSPWVKI